MGRRIAILIGVANYDCERFSDLPTPENDVRVLSELLMDGEVGGFDICVKSNDGDRREILNKIAAVVSECGPNDTFLFYYSGHGVALPDLKLYLTARETDPSDIFATGISVSEVLSEFDRCTARRQIAIFDSCQSGAFHLNTPVDFGRNLKSLKGETEKFGEGVGRQFICASDENTPAIASTPESSSALSKLTSAICYGLDTGDADIDSDGFVSMNDLSQYCDRVVDYPSPYSWSYKTSGKSLVARNRKFRGFDYRSLSTLDDELISGLASNSLTIRLGSISELSRLVLETGERSDAAKVALSHLANSKQKEIGRAASIGLNTALRMYALPEGQPTTPPSAERTVRIEPSYNLALEFQFVPSGPFLMGGDPDKKYTKGDQLPLHIVETNSFWISKTPITQAQFARFVKEDGYLPSSERPNADRVSFNATDNKYHKTGRNWKHPFSRSNNYQVFKDHPAVFISFWDALAFCQWVSAGVGLPVNLPTEAEWEKAARGTDDRQWPWGNTPPSRYHANFGHRTSSTTPVGTFSEYGSSPYGCLDMSGNVWEWTTGLHQGYPYSRDRHPEDLNIRAKRVLRGGSWNVGKNRTTVSFRKIWGSDRCCDGHGFRAVIRMPQEQVESHLA